MTDVLIVTYGSRWQYLRQVLVRLISDPAVRHITIVNNDSEYNVTQETWKFNTGKITVLDLPHNRGSAYGFKYGMEYLANRSDTQLILLLDDDNVPDKGCITGITRFWNDLNDPAKETTTALLTQRPNRTYLRLAAKGIATFLFFPLKNHYLGFHVFRPDIWLMKKIYPRFVLRGKKDREFVPVPCAPYGGLLFHKHILSHIGLPDERFFTYADDYDFTIRITEHGGRILLLPSYTISDVDTPLVNTGKKGMFSPKFLAMDPWRLHYLMRNTMYFTKQHMVTGNLMFFINRMLYTSYIFLLSLAFQKRKAFGVFRKAVKLGLKKDFNNNPQPQTGKGNNDQDGSQIRIS